jgi:CubicO group peptidase (beta-lactamase class C family)
MKTAFKVLLYVLVILVIIDVVAGLCGYSYLNKGLWATYMHGHNTASIDDARFFDTHPIAAASNPWHWPVSANYNQQPLAEPLKEVLSKTESVAFLIIKNDSILSEHYWDGYTDSSLSNSFSMAKSITTMLTQIAIQKGVLKGWHQKVNTILPDLKGPHAGELELWHLSAMCSGLDWDEQYKNPFTVTAKAYYGADVKSVMLTLPIINQPGKEYYYQSGNTELLGICLIQASGKPLAQLASEWLWQPLQAEREAKWHTDAKGTELAYCCFNSDARDFARFGKMMLHEGNWNGTQIIDSSFVQLATTGALVPYYGYSFWIDESHGTKVFARLGKHSLPPQNHMPEDFNEIVTEVLKMLK